MIPLLEYLDRERVTRRSGHDRVVSVTVLPARCFPYHVRERNEHMTAPSGGRPERPVRGMLRVPFVRRCALTFSKGRTESAFIVNINVLGAYIAMDELPDLARHRDLHLQPCRTRTTRSCCRGWSRG